MFLWKTLLHQGLVHNIGTSNEWNLKRSFDVLEGLYSTIPMAKDGTLHISRAHIRPAGTKCIIRVPLPKYVYSILLKFINKLSDECLTISMCIQEGPDMGGHIRGL
jgi:hypothetical protein